MLHITKFDSLSLIYMCTKYKRYSLSSFFFSLKELNYIEVCFDKKPKHPYKIHGLEERSDYVEIDFTKTVDRLPDCDKDDVSDDDFVSLEDVKSMKRKTQFTN